MGAVRDILSGGGYDYIKNPRSAPAGMPANPGFDALLGLLAQPQGGGGGGGFGGGGAVETFGQGSIDELIWRAPGHEGHLHFASPDINMGRLARRLERKGFDIGELGNFQGAGPITGGHTSGSEHYQINPNTGFGEAFDANYNGGGRWKSEPEALDWLAAMLQRKYG